MIQPLRDMLKAYGIGDNEVCEIKIFPCWNIAYNTSTDTVLHKMLHRKKVSKITSRVGPDKYKSKVSSSTTGGE
jgi:hypothetical protein